MPSLNGCSTAVRPCGCLNNGRRQRTSMLRRSNAFVLRPVPGRCVGFASISVGLRHHGYRLGSLRDQRKSAIPPTGNRSKKVAGGKRSATPGNVTTRTRVDPGGVAEPSRSNRSFQIFRIVLDPGALQNHLELFAKCSFAVMFGLIGDVIGNAITRIEADRDDGVSVL